MICFEIRAWATGRIFFLDGNTAVIDVDLDATGLLPVLVELIAQYHDGDADRADDEVEKVPFHLLIEIVWSAFDQPNDEEQQASTYRGVDDGPDNVPADKYSKSRQQKTGDRCTYDTHDDVANKPITATLHDLTG
jgi:hypothetical protein